MMGPIRRQKLTYLFQILDVNHSGTIDLDDVRHFVDLLAQARYYAPGSLAYAALLHAYTHLWQELAKQIDADDDGTITTEEWLSFFETKANPQTFYEDVIRPIERTMIALLDVDGDDRIRLSDYYALARACRLSQPEIEAVFNKVDSDRDGVLSPQEAGQAITQFFLSEDPNQRGNWFFGDYTRLTP